ncbi:hypothetical protein ABLE92_15340 [Gordonia sp. VNQ95]|uniref:hypothetical protein n=1 Tax=Gordonia sp. VNQ95 TaxID=3156619 RepID=UPI0032B3F6B7
MTSTAHLSTARLAAAGVGVACLTAGALALTAPAAHAGTLPVTHPGEPTIAMTITNHTDKTEHLLNDGTSPNGIWVNAPRQTLAPGATETVTAVAPHGTTLDMHVAYRVGLAGPTATYEVSNNQHNANIANTGVTGPFAKNYWINHTFSSHYPNTNIGFDLW